MRLREVVGQDHAVAILTSAVASRRVPHAYLFEGPPGVGKRSAALGLALALACLAKPGTGCGACEVCRRIEDGLHPDVPLVAPDGTSILIDQAQAVVAMAAGRPHEAPARVIVIDDADRMNPSAANCLLKTLEEPAPDTHLVLVTAAPDRLLSTIRSRTQSVRFVAVATAPLVELLITRGVERGPAELAAALADGSVARALELAGGESDGGPWEAVAALRDAARAGSIGVLFDAAAAWGAKEAKQALPAVLALLARLYRDALAAACGAPDLVLLRERGDAVGEIAALGPRAVRRALGTIVEASDALGANVNAVAAIERLLMELRTFEGRATG